MPPHGFGHHPPRWTDEELREQRNISEELFRRQRRNEGPIAFANICAQIKPKVTHALEMSGDLLSLQGETLLDEPQLWQIFRYFCGPPVSEEDLWTLVGGPKFKSVPPDYADETAQAIKDVLDTVRFPWVEEGRHPRANERDAAILATTILIANRTIGTSRRGESSKRQEANVASSLQAVGFSFDSSRSEISFVDDMLRGSFSKERKLAGAKSDVPVRLHDGRLLALECKVSNGPKNSWKRVNREAGGKADRWKRHFGSQAVTAVVLSGVFDLACLKSAQDAGLFLFWEHDLEPLASFVRLAS